MPLAQIFDETSTNQIVYLTDILPTANPNNTLVGLYITGTLGGADVLTEVQNPTSQAWMPIEDLSWRASYPDGSQNPLPDGGSDGATYLTISWKFRFQIQNAGVGTTISLAMNW